jgi:hypothetical protein
MVNHTSRLVLFISIALAASYWCVNPTSLQAQTVSGTILGQIQDQQGAAIGKVEVTVKSLDTGAIRTATADDGGAYRITSVPAGSYEVSAAIAGFKTEVRSGIVVTVGSDVAVNFSLTVGAVTEKVEVTGEALQVNTSSSTLGGFVNSTTIRELPLNGRDWLQLALLQPGVNVNASQNQNDLSRAQRGNGLAISISGGRTTDNAFRIDGLIVNDYVNSGPGSALRVNMGVDAIREFSVLTNSYSAEYGRGSGGVVNAITKSGTNEIHGSAYYFHRNSALDARNFFDQLNIPPFRRHQYGGAVGGPMRKDKTFFFTNYESLHEIKSLSAGDNTLSANARNGILCANADCTQTTQVAINPKVQPFVGIFPLPNGPVSGNTGKFLFSPKRLGEENYVIGKMDHYFSAATTLSGSYTYDNTTVSNTDNYNLKDTLVPSKRQNVVLNLQHIFSPSLINNVRAGITRFYGGNNFDINPKIPQLSDPAFGFMPGQLFGQLRVSGVAQGTNVGGIPSGLGASGQNNWGYTAPQMYDDLSWTKGRHSLRTGFSFERIDLNELAAQSPNGAWSFSSIQNFLQGIPSQFQADFPGTDTIRGLRTSLIGGYIQDDFRMRSNLTLNLGVRYEMSTVVSEVNGKLANLRNLTDPQVSVGAPYYNNPTRKNFAPRVGFAWDPFRDGKTAVRGGFGMFDIAPLPYLFLTYAVRSAPFFKGGQLSNPPPSSFPNQVSQLLLPSSLTASHIEFNPRPAYRMQWNLNIQRQLTRTVALTLGYVGSSGVHLARQERDTDVVPASLVQFNSALDALVFPIPAPGAKPQRINPNFGQILGHEWSGGSNYHGLQANLVQRPTKNLSYQLSYTWGKSIDNGSNSMGGVSLDAGNTAPTPWAFNPRIQRGVSDFDVPHNFVANFQYDLPVPSAVKTRALANTLLGGWQVGGIYTRQNGGPFTLLLGSDQAFTGNSQAGNPGGAQSPMYFPAPGCRPNATTGNINQILMTQCFAFPAPGVLGNMGRNTLRMPVFRDLDFSVFKNQNVWGEKLKAQLRVEMFNVLNNTNLTANVITLFDGTGKVLPAAGTPLAPTANTSRQIQIGLRLLF